MSLSQIFKTRLCNFKCGGLNSASSRTQPPYCIRGNFDGRAFNSENFHSASMSPMWSLDINFDYHCASVETLGTKFLVVEVYGADSFLGLCRLDLMTIATGPKSVQLSIRDGSRVTGNLSFEISFELISHVTLQFSSLRLARLASRGYESTPNPYLVYGFQESGNTIESAVAANAESPEWEQLPALHIKTSYENLCEQRIKFELKHSRNGFTAGISDPLMATFVINLQSLPITVGRDTTVPIREMVHSTANYPFPFSTEMSGIVEFRNIHKVVQQRAGLLTDEGVVGGVSHTAASPARLRSPGATARLNTSASMGGGASYLHRSPERIQRSTMNEVSNLSPSRTYSQSSYVQQQQQQQQQQHSYLYGGAATSAPNNTMSMGINASQVPSADLEVLDEVTQKQNELLRKVQGRLQEVARRKAEVAQQLSTQKMREESDVEAASQRRAALDADLRTALSERERLEDALRSIQARRDEEVRNAAQQAADRERAKRALEDEHQEARLMQERVVHLRHEMTRHLEEEERRYQIRVREAEDARRRTIEDEDTLAQLEGRLTEAEARAAHRNREEQVRSVRRSRLR